MQDKLLIIASHSVVHVHALLSIALKFTVEFSCMLCIYIYTCIYNTDIMVLHCLDDDGVGNDAYRISS